MVMFTSKELDTKGKVAMPNTQIPNTKNISDTLDKDANKFFIIVFVSLGFLSCLSIYMMITLWREANFILTEKLYHINYLKVIWDQKQNRLVVIVVYIQIEGNFVESIEHLLLEILILVTSGDRDSLRDEERFNAKASKGF